jgi:hypothetical protein
MCCGTKTGYREISNQKSRTETNDVTDLLKSCLETRTLGRSYSSIGAKDIWISAPLRRQQVDSLDGTSYFRKATNTTGLNRTYG